MGSYQTFYTPTENSIVVKLRFLDTRRTGGGVETKKKLVGIVSLDLSKAFDTIPHALPLARLEAYGMSSSVTSEWAAVSRGVPQGSKNGPLFFNIFVNDLFYHITEVKFHAYADDEQLYDSDTDPKLFDRRLMHQLNIAN